MTNYRKSAGFHPTFTICTFGQLSKALGRTLQARGIKTDASEVHLEKAKSPIDVTEDAIVTNVSELHPKKAPSAIEFTDDGIVADASEVHSAKA